MKHSQLYELESNLERSVRFKVNTPTVFALAR